jgi:S1-C subfamily serine protease
MKHPGEIMVARRRRLSLRWSAGDSPGASPPEIDFSQRDDIEKLDSYSQAIAAAVHKVGRAIVSVQAGAPDQARPGVGLGSAVVVSPRGILLTSSQVVHDSTALTIRFPDGQRLPATVVGMDPSTDVAILSVEAKGLEFLPLEDGPRLTIGDTILAVGNPRGHHSMVATGVVLSLGRSLRSRAHHLLEGLIQHSAQTSEGMAGGALLDRQGRLVGFLTDNVALGHQDHFSVPIATAAWVLPQLHTRGSVRRGRIGVAGEAHELPASLRQKHGLTQEKGIVVLGIEIGGPASVAGLQQGDWIVALNGQSCSTLEDLDHYLEEWPLRRPLHLTLLRQEAILDVDIVPVTYGA